MRTRCMVGAAAGYQLATGHARRCSAAMRMVHMAAAAAVAAAAAAAAAVHLSQTAPELLGSVLPRHISSGYCFFGCAFYLAVEYVAEAATAEEVKQWGMDKVQHCYS